MSYPILVVEDSPLVIKVIKHVLNSQSTFEPVYAESLVEAQKAVESRSEHSPFFAALVDLSLPDAPNGEVVDYTLAQHIPSIVLTGSFDETRRETLLSKGIVDYVTKEGKFSYVYAVNVLHQLVKNQHRKVLVVDDSVTARKYLKGFLRLQLFQVIEAADGKEAIKMIVEHPDICLMITDFNMPGMDGCELVKVIRTKYEKTDLAIIGLSSEGEHALSARFIKNGASDFLRKPFYHEEFFCRVNHNLELLDAVEEIRDASYRDELTGVFNRQHFFKLAREKLNESQNHGASFSLGVINLDDFAQCNHQHGSAAGDKLLELVAGFLEKAFSRFVFARASADEFYVAFNGLPPEKAEEYLSKVRHLFAMEVFDVGEQKISLTFSAGIACADSHGVEHLVQQASENLRRAKDAGGDLVLADQQDDLE